MQNPSKEPKTDPVGELDESKKRKADTITDTEQFSKTKKQKNVETEEQQFLAISGLKESGKDLLGNYILCSREGYRKIAIATPLKISASATFKFSFEQLFDEKLKQEVDPRWGFTPREALQKLGTELMRNDLPKYLPVEKGMIWKKSFQLWLDEVLRNDSKAKIIVTDCRFPDEEEFLRNLGFYIVKVKREGQQCPSTGHASETSVDLVKPDVEIYNNGTDKMAYYAQIEDKLSKILSPIKPDFDLLATGKVNVSEKEIFRNELLNLVK